MAAPAGVSSPALSTKMEKRIERWCDVLWCLFAALFRLSRRIELPFEVCVGVCGCLCVFLSPVDTAAPHTLPHSLTRLLAVHTFSLHSARLLLALLLWVMLLD
jgi:hypothetical protein